MPQIKIDEINAKILRRLLLDARISFTQMAKENNISTVALRSRYEKLKQNGIIQEAIMQINPYYLGFNCVGYLGISVKSEKIEETEKCLEKKPYILSIWKKCNKFNLGSFFATPDLEYFNAVQDELRSDPNIQEIESLIYVGFLVNDHPENLIINSDIVVEKESFKENKPVHRFFKNKKYVATNELKQMSQIDRLIAEALSNDARVSFRQIAKQLEISTSNVINKYQKLMKENLFLRSTISIDLRKIGYKSRMLIYFNIKHGTKFSEMEKILLKIPNLIVLIKTLGETDMFAICPISNFEEFFRIKKILYETSEIKDVNIDLVPLGTKWPFNFFANIL